MYRREHLVDGFSPGFRASPMRRFIEDAAQARGHLVDVPSVIELFRAHGQPDPEALFAIECPTLLVMGSNDYAYERSRTLQERIVGSEFATIEGAGHACNIERPGEWDALVEEFLRWRTQVLTSWKRA